MSSPKTRNVFGFMAKPESTYGTAVSLASATDGILLIDEPDVTPEYVHDGSRNGVAVGIGPIKRVNKTGRAGKLTAKSEARGFGAAYSASNLPSLDRLLKAAGYGATVVVTGGAETVTYAQIASGFTSLTAEAYVNGMKYPLAGVYADYSVSCDVGGVPQHEFPLSGIWTATETDVAVPAIVYPSVDPPKAESMTLTIANYLPALVKSFQFSLNRNISARAYDNTQGRHGGFTPGMIDPTLEVVVEMVALATTTPWNTSTTLNPRELAERASALAVSLIIGSVQYNKYKLSGPTAQLIEVEELEDGPTSEWRLKFSLPPSTPAGVDGHNWLYN